MYPRVPRIELTEKETLRLIKRWQKKRDVTARNRLVEANLPLVIRWAHGDKDAVQCGVEGLIRALDTYDPKIAKLSTYAVPWIRSFIQRWRLTPNMIRLSKEMIRERMAAGLPPLPPPDRSLDTTPLHFTSYQGDSLEFVQPKEVVDDRTPEDAAAEGEESITNTVTLARLLSKLQPRERLVIQRLFLDDPPAGSLQVVAVALGCSRERVRQIRDEALAVLKGTKKRPPGYRQPSIEEYRERAAKRKKHVVTPRARHAAPSPEQSPARQPSRRRGSGT